MKLDNLDDLLRHMVERKASDLHLRVGLHPILRINEELVHTEYDPMSKEDIERLALGIMNEEQKQMFKHDHELDMAYSVSGLARFRLNVFFQRGTVSMALRMVPIQILGYEELNLPPIIATLSEKPRGLVLVTGTTGSGKSTTLAAMVDHINTTRKAHIITIEDPIEFLHKDKLSILSQREVGLDTRNFVTALRHVMRQDPNVVLIGEMRDLETMSSALTAAQLGHLVLSTLHTIDAVQTISRIIDLFPPYQQTQVRLQMANTLQGVISQRLLPRIDQPGLVPAVEILIATPYVKKLIEENNLGDLRKAIQEGGYYGMQSFNQALVALYKGGKVSLEEALSSASNPEELMLNIRGIYSGSDMSLGKEK
ncbi:MAG: type IV pilus twitching motility protein PilT [bacterium]|nr:type IV pilus twitching motility protein PilT [bacterium]